ncbi:MAG: Mu transposase C-terminal domain-containing protein, partial [Firmicutes bacterium]|nr:Mu transposase C-terminal domain-containing protein [Bacillota bacterium]
GYVPRQILHDNHKAYYSGQYKKFSNAAFELGIDFRTSRIGNARDKAHVERWFGTFQTEFTNSLFGSLGEGIKTSRVGGRVGKEMQGLYTKNKYLRDEKTLRRLIKVLIAKYNHKPRKNGKSPNDIFEEADKANLVQLKKPDIVRMFYQNKVRQVKNCQISFTYEGQPYTYKIENNILANKLNGSEVTVMYDIKDLSSVAIYDKKGQDYICDLQLEEKINVIPKKRDKLIISKHYWSLKKRVEQNLAELMGDIEYGREQLEAIPVVALNPKAHLEEILNNAENEWFSKTEFKSQLKAKPIIKKKDRPPLPRIYNVKGSLRKIN